MSLLIPLQMFIFITGTMPKFSQYQTAFIRILQILSAYKRGWNEEMENVNWTAKEEKENRWKSLLETSVLEKKSLLANYQLLLQTIRLLINMQNTINGISHFFILLSLLPSYFMYSNSHFSAHCVAMNWNQTFRQYMKLQFVFIMLP